MRQENRSMAASHSSSVLAVGPVVAIADELISVAWMLSDSSRSTAFAVPRRDFRCCDSRDCRGSRRFASRPAMLQNWLAGEIAGGAKTQSRPARPSAGAASCIGYNASTCGGPPAAAGSSATASDDRGSRPETVTSAPPACRAGMKRNGHEPGSRRDGHAQHASSLLTRGIARPKTRGPAAIVSPCAKPTYGPASAVGRPRLLGVPAAADGGGRDLRG